MVLGYKPLANINLKPADKISTEIHGIQKAPISSFEGAIPAMYYNSKIYFLCKMYRDILRRSCVDTTIWYDPLVGIFHTIRNQEVVCFACTGYNGTTLLALGKKKQFFLLKDDAWEVASIPSLPVDDLQNPVILTYQSLLIVVNGSAVWVHGENLCDWIQFELLIDDGDFKTSPKNSFAILGGKLFACNSSQETVHCVELQQVIDITLKYSNSEIKKEDSSSKQQNNSKPKQGSDNKGILQLNRILKGATFIFLHAENLLAFHNTPSSVDRVWYYDVRCYHWHNVEYNSKDVTGVMQKNWISLCGCAGILEFAWATWGTAWGNAKLYNIQLSSS